MTINGKGYVGGGQNGSLNLTVVSGLEQPTAPLNNTVWLNSELPVNGVYIGPACEILEPAQGDVWINNSVRYQAGNPIEVSSATCTMVVSQEPYLLINILQVSQWNGSEWMPCNGAVFANYAWTDMALYLFYHGTVNTDYPLEVGQAALGAETAESELQPAYNSEYMVVEGDGDAVYCTLTTQQGCAIDAGRFSTLGLGYCRQGGTLNGGMLYCGFTSNVDSPISYEEADDAQSIKLDDSEELQEVSIPVECSGMVRPAIKFCSSPSSPYSLAVHYWLLT